MSNPFEYSNAINAGRDIEIGDDYNKFLMNRSFSFYPDTIVIANEINQYPDLDNQMHFDFLRGMIRPRKRYAKWPKPMKHDKASALSAYYQVPMTRAYEYIEFFTEEEFDQILEHLKEQKDNLSK